MADFYQNGTITTLHNLGARSTAELEEDLLQFSERRPLGLILPSLYSEIATPALPAMLRPGSISIEQPRSPTGSRITCPYSMGRGGALLSRR